MIYFIITADRRCLLLYAYSKSEQDDLSPKNKRMLKALVQAAMQPGGE